MLPSVYYKKHCFQETLATLSPVVFMLCLNSSFLNQPLGRMCKGYGSCLVRFVCQSVTTLASSSVHICNQRYSHAKIRLKNPSDCGVKGQYANEQAFFSRTKAAQELLEG